MKYEITYKYTSTRISTVEADNEEEAIKKFNDGHILEDSEEDCEDSVFQDIKKI
jgi:hypothetical protein